MTEWKTIDKMPKSIKKSGKPVDVWSESHGRCTNVKWEQLSRTNGFFSPVQSGYSCIRDATHYMDIPDAPTNSKEGI